MKKIFSLSIVSLFLLSATCKKSTDDSGGGPDVTLPTSGFLCTNGKTHVGSIVNFFFTTGGWNLTSYTTESWHQGDQVSFQINSNNSISIQKKTPYVYQNKNYKWFAIEVNGFPQGSSFPNHAYLWELSDTESEFSQFILHRNENDKLKFTLESKKYPGYYLSVGKAKSTLQNIDDNLTFAPGPKEWWFEKP